MTKSLLYRLFGIGKIPPKLRADLEREGIIALDEGIPGSATYRNLRRPGRYSAWRRQWYTACIALTRVRLVALRYGSAIIDVPLTDGRIRSLRFSLGDDGAVLAVAFDANLFHADWSGSIEYRFRTPYAQTILTQMERELAT